MYTYPGRFFKMSTGNALNTLQIEQLEWNKKMFYGRSTVPSMIPGKKFTLKNHPRLDANTEYVIYEVEHFLDVSASIFICLIVNGISIHIIYKRYELERKLNQIMLNQAINDKELIEKSMNEIQILRGFLPICSHCKKIKDDKGDWNQLELFIQNN